ncbi:MAG TPA: glycosyltransferase WbuB, partial [Anaerolineae bacterium]|nr:glycosyltransferase WbuB [Anaerolineae bacterium]
MKIAFLLTQSLSSPSGLGRYGPLAREIVNLGHNVEIIALHPAWDTLHKKSFNDNGVHINYVGQMHVMKKGSRKTYYKPSQLLWISMKAVTHMAKALRQSDAEIIHICKPQPFNVLAAKLGSKTRPVFCDCDDYEAETNRFTYNWQRAIVRYFEDNIVNFVKGITTNTQFTHQRYTQLGFPSNRISYIPNGVERNRFCLPV